jgi:hypothetical protein
MIRNSRRHARAATMHRPTTDADPLNALKLLARRLAMVLVGAGLLAACAGKSNVSLLSQVNFAPAPATDPAPLIQGPQAIAAALARGGYVIYLRHGRTQ